MLCLVVFAGVPALSGDSSCVGMCLRVCLRTGSRKRATPSGRGFDPTIMHLVLIDKYSIAGILQAGMGVRTHAQRLFGKHR